MELKYGRRWVVGGVCPAHLGDVEKCEARSGMITKVFAGLGLLLGPGLAWAPLTGAESIKYREEL